MTPSLIFGLTLGLGGENRMQLFDPIFPHLSNLKVRAPFIPGCKRWNLNLLSSILDPAALETVNRMPISLSYAVDSLIWSPEASSTYYVKSAYRICMGIGCDSSSLFIVGNWANIWNLDIPHKVRVFLWQLCCNCLPDCIALQ